MRTVASAPEHAPILSRARRHRTALALALLATLAGCVRDDGAAILGTLEWDRIDLVAEASEPLLAVAVREGEHVVEGDLLLQLDDARPRTDVASADAELARLAALLEEQRNGARPEELDEARARTAQAATELRDAEQALARVGAIRARGLVSAADFDRARNARDAAAAAVNAARARAKLLESGTRAETIAQTEAAIAAARARRDAAALRVDRLRIEAPRAGRVETLPFEVGDQPVAGATVARLLVGRAPYARLYLPESVRAAVHEGDAYAITVEGVAEPLQGRVRALAAEPSFTPYFALTGEDASRLVYRAEVELTGDAAAQLPAGLPVRATPAEQP